MTTTMEPTDRQPQLFVLLHLVTGKNHVESQIDTWISFCMNFPRYRGVDGYRRARCDSGTGDTFRQVADTK